MLILRRLLDIQVEMLRRHVCLCLWSLGDKSGLGIQIYELLAYR